MQTLQNPTITDIVHSKVEIYTSISIISGVIAHTSSQRLLDFLNQKTEEAEHKGDYLRVKDALIYTADEEKEFIPHIYINKLNIFFIVEVGDGQQAIGVKEYGEKVYPYVKKEIVSVKFYMPLYTLTGCLHYPKGQNPINVLGVRNRFFPLTDIKIASHLSIGNSDSRFAAVNREQVLYIGAVAGIAD